MSMQLALPGIELPPTAKAAPAPYSYIRSAMHEAANRMAKYLPGELDGYLDGLSDWEQELVRSLGEGFAGYAVERAKARIVDTIRELAEREPLVGGE